MYEAHNLGRKRVFKQRPGRPLFAINQYILPILQKVLKKMDERGENLQLARKYEVYRDIIANPTNYLEFGGSVTRSFSLSQIPDNIKDYANSSFLKNCYKTRKTSVNSTILNEQEKLYHGKPKIVSTIKDVTIWLSEVYEFHKSEIERLFPGVTNKAKIRIGEIEAFNHEHFKQLEFTKFERNFKASDLFNNTWALMRLEKELTINIPELLRASAEKFTPEKFYFQDNWARINEYNPKTLNDQINSLKYHADKEKIWGEHHYKIQEYVEILLEYSVALAYTIDQSSFLYGSSGLRFVQSGKHAGTQRKSSKPRASASVIVAQNGKNLWSVGVIFKSPYKNASKNDIALKMLYHGDLAVDKDALIYFQKTGSCNSDIFASYCLYHWEKMPLGPKLGFQDVAKCNSSWVSTCASIERNIRIVECASYLTSVLGGPDDRFFNIVKNGDKLNNIEKGVKQIVQDWYNSEKDFPLGPQKDENNVIKPMSMQVFWKILNEVITSVNTNVMLESMYSCGFFILTNFFGAARAKEFVKRALLIDRSELSKIVAPTSLYGKNLEINEILKIMEGMIDEPIYESRRKKKYSCPAPLCKHKPFKTLKEQIAHSTRCRVLAKPFINVNRIKADRIVRRLRRNEKTNKKRARQHRIKTGKTMDSRFECPCCNTFQRWSWKDCSISILKHYCEPTWRHYCPKFDEEKVLNLFRKHPLFRSERIALAKRKLIL